MKKLLGIILSATIGLTMLGAAVPAMACQVQSPGSVFICPPVIHDDARATQGDQLVATFTNSGEPALVVISYQRNGIGLRSFFENAHTLYADIIEGDTVVNFVAPAGAPRAGWRIVAGIYNCGDPDVETVELVNLSA